jgi:hypothetical protein
MKIQRKKLSSILIIAMIISIASSDAYALTQGQKSIGNIGVNITWYDFGKAYTDYSIGEAAGYYALSMNYGETSKTAFINGKGEIVLKPDTYDSGSSGSLGESISQRGTHYVYIDSSGITSVDGNAYSEIGNFYNGYATVTLKSNSGKGVIDKNGDLIFEDKTGKYNDFRYLGSGIFAAEISENNYNFLDSIGVLLNETAYTNDWLWEVSDETILVKKDGKYGFLDLPGSEIVPCIYNDAYPFREGLAAVCKDGKWGFVDKTGKEVIPPAYDYILSYRYENGLAGVTVDGKWGLIDKSGQFVLPMEYEDIRYYENGFFVANKENRAFLIDDSGKPVSGMDYYSSIGFDESGRIYVSKMLNGSTVYACLDENWNMLTGWKEYNLIYHSDQLYSGIKRGEYPPGIVPPHDYSMKIAVLDSEGNNLTGFKYSNSGNFSNNFQVVNKYYYGSAGLVNQYGAEVLPTIFQDILLTDEGYAFVTIGDENGGNTRVGYFKIPESFSDVKSTRPVTVYLNGAELYFDADPVIINQRSMVLMRKIFEAQGADVLWDDNTKTVTSKRGDTEIRLTIGSGTAYVNGTEVQLDAAPFIQGGRTLVPLRFVSESLGADVQWDNDLRRVMITSTYYDLENKESQAQDPDGYVSIYITGRAKAENKTSLSGLIKINKDLGGRTISFANDFLIKNALTKPLAVGQIRSFTASMEADNPADYPVKIRRWTAPSAFTKGMIAGPTADLALRFAGKSADDPISISNGYYEEDSVSVLNGSDQEIRLDDMYLTYNISRVEGNGEARICSYKIPSFDGGHLDLPAGTGSTFSIPAWDFKDMKGDPVSPGKYAVEIYVPDNFEYSVAGEQKTLPVRENMWNERYEFLVTN